MRMSMGRPPKKAADKRDTDIRVRVNAAELATLTEAAEQAGLPVSSWLRMVGLSQTNQ
jgi:predicted DNA binding CopG/RHH family protein